MPTVQASYFLANRLVGQSTFQTKTPQRSLAYLCLTCGEVWGRAMVTNDGGVGLWTPVCCPCEKHTRVGVQDWSKIPGSFITQVEDLMGPAGFSAASFSNIPPPLLSRELTLHLHHYESINHDQA